MARDQTAGLSGIGASIRSIFSRLSPLEKRVNEQDAGIEELKARAAAAEAELSRLSKVADQQGAELAKNQRDVDNLQRAVSELQSEIDDKTDDIQGLKSALHGERVKRGLAKSKLEKIESVSKRRGR